MNNFIEQSLSLKELVKLIPNFADSVEMFMTDNTLEMLGKRFELNAINEEDRKKKKNLFIYLQNIWEDVPNTLRLQIMAVIYSNLYFNNNVFLVSAIHTLISLYTINHSDFSEKLLNKINKNKT